jgi:hypothetical protein
MRNRHEKEAGVGIRRRRSNKVIRWATFIVGVAAIVQELKKPSDERTWNGEVAGFIPYDFRPPSMDRVRSRWWDPSAPLIQPQVFGVGWTLNLGRLLAVIRGEA